MGAGRRPTGNSEIPDLGGPPPGPNRAAGRSGMTPAATGSLAPRRMSGMTPAASSSLPPKRMSGMTPAATGSLPSPSLTPQSSLESNAGAGDALFGSGTFDAEHFGGESLSLSLADDAELDDGHRTTHSISLEDGEDVLEQTATSARSLPARPLESARHWPSGLSPDSASIELDTAEVAMTAEYGAAPAGYLEALGYAARVFNRKRALRARVKELNDRFLSAERDRDALLAGMIDALRPALERSPDGRKVLESLGRIEALADEKRSALTGLNAGFTRLGAELTVEATGLANERAANERDQELARAVLAERLHAHDRVEARRKRLYIEVRAVLDVVEKAGGQPSPAQAAQLAAREAEIAAQKPELEHTEREVTESEAVVAAAEVVGKDIARRARDVERRRAVLATEAQKQLGAHSQGVNEAEAHRSEAVVEAARSVLAARGRVADVPGSTLDAIARADEAVAGRARDLERHVRALDAYDRDGMKKGVTAALAILAAVMIVLLVVLGR